MLDIKPRDVQVASIAVADTTILRSRTWDRLKFEVEYALQRGTTANSYLIKSDKTALIDPPGESFTETLLHQLQQSLELQQLDYVILGHVNPNRMVTLILKEGMNVRRHFLKPFAPGEDRFAGLDTQEAENGCPIINDALAYLECTVMSRMDCGDHWLVYAVVDNGQVLQSTGMTAVHHRKSGSQY